MPRQEPRDAAGSPLQNPHETSGWPLRVEAYERARGYAWAGRAFRMWI